MATDRLAFWAVSTVQRLHMQQLRLLATKINADNKMQADDSSCGHYAAEVFRRVQEANFLGPRKLRCTRRNACGLRRDVRKGAGHVSQWRMPLSMAIAGGMILVSTNPLEYLVEAAIKRVEDSATGVVSELA